MDGINGRAWQKTDSVCCNRTIINEGWCDMAQHEAERVITLKLITIFQSVCFITLILLQLSHDYKTFFWRNDVIHLIQLYSYVWHCGKSAKQVSPCHSLTGLSFSLEVNEEKSSLLLRETTKRKVLSSQDFLPVGTSVEQLYLWPSQMWHWR